MPSVKVAITLEQETLRQVDSLVARRVFPNRSRRFKPRCAKRSSAWKAGVSRRSAPSSIRRSSGRSLKKGSARTQPHGRNSEGRGSLGGPQSGARR